MSVFIADVDRRLMLDFLEPRSEAAKALAVRADRRELLKPIASELRAVWIDDPSEGFGVPVAIIVQKAPIRDLLAWTATYARNLRPLTGVCRVVDAELVSRLENKPECRCSGRIHCAFVGMVLAEANGHLGLNGELRRIGFNACTSTLSFVIGKAVSQAGPEEPGSRSSLPAQLTESWSKARDLTRQPPISATMNSLLEPWQALLAICDKRLGWQSEDARAMPIAIRACQDVLDDGEIGDHTWQRMTTALPRLKEFPEISRGPREQRLRAARAVVEEVLATEHVPESVRGMLAGYSVSRINPGTLDHIALLAPLLDRFPSSLLWYGLFAGLVGSAELYSFGNGVGWLVGRELARRADWLSRPTCDIALNELEMLSGASSDPREIRTTFSNVISVELIPGVNSTMRWPPARDSARADVNTSQAQRTEGQRTLFERASVGGEVQKMLDEVQRSLELILRIQGRLSGESQAEETPPPRRRRKR